MFSSQRRALVRPLLGALALAACYLTGGLAQAQTPVRLLVGFPPGGGTDAIARTLAERMGPLLGSPVIVENRAGAGGQIAAQALKAAPADGHVFFVTHDHTISVLPQVVKSPGFDPAKDFVPVAGFATFANALAVSGNTPAKTFTEYVAWVKAQGGKSSVGIPAPASTPEFMVKLAADTYKLDLQSVPYRGSAPMLADMLGGQISAGIGSVPDFIENQKAGKLRIVAVVGDKRQALLPDVPTFAELGLPGLEDMPYYGVFAPAGTPQPVVDRFSAALAQVLAQAEVRDRFTGLGLAVQYMPQATFAARERAYTQAWGRIIKSSGFQPQ